MESYGAELGRRVTAFFEWPEDHKKTARETKILLHYTHEVDSGHMNTVDAFERTTGDIKGRNYFEGKDQR